MLCVCCGTVWGLQVDCRGSVDTSVRVGVLEAQDAALWVWSAPSLPVQLPAECTLIINTLGFRGHTPWVWALKWAWSGCLHLT